MSINNLDAVFIDVADFYLTFLPAWEKHLISSGIKQRNKQVLPFDQLSRDNYCIFSSIAVS
ncbi:hypothetical protein [Candidatus Enterovibrio escicola]|uniref:hypothetical protein n=1 Tax=Candidatus Enterovibrio escicola TaxID=1927127 RepID=UPI0018F108A2|nr:hypothetical protein [Candidatus Enterovibrio escacola]